MSKRKPPRRGPVSKRAPTKKPAAARKATTRKPVARKKTTARKPAAARKTSAARAPREAAVLPLLDDNAQAAGPSLASSSDLDWSWGQMLRSIDIRDRRTRIALGSAALVVVLLAAVIAWPGGGTDTTGQLAQDAADVAGTTEVAPDAPVVTEAPKAQTNETAPAAQAPADPAAENPSGDRAQALKIGAMIEPQSTTYGDNPNTWTGVTKDSIKFAIAYDASNCGVNTLTLAQQTTANLPSSNRYYRGTPKNQQQVNDEFREAADVLVQTVNRRALEGAEDFPKIRALMGNDPSHPFFGRKIVYEFVDGGSYQCPETTTAAAIRIVEDIKPFVVINDDGLSRSAYNMAAALNAKAPPSTRPMHFGTLSESDSLYKKWAPFAWTQFASGTAQMRQYASWLCARVTGKNAVNSEQFKGQKRKIALLYPNFQQVKTIANELKNFTNQYCGGNPFAAEFAYNTDPSRAADEGTSMAVRLKVDGFTSVAYLLDLFSPLFHIISFKSQDYRPEFIFTPTNYMDSSTVQRIYEQDMVDRASFGVSNLGVPGGFGYSAGDPFYAYHDLHKKSPNTGKACDPSSDAGMNHDPTYCKAPSAIVTLYYSVLPLLGGILFAGPDLNPTNVTNGLQEYPQTRFGGAGPTTDPRPALVGAGKDRFYFLVDSTEWKWRANFVSPAPESKLGWVEYPDCQRHYIMWPDKLAPGWEKDGPNYGAWCGDAKYAPNPNRPAPNTEESCSDAPAGKCENDKYPPHPPEGKRP